MQLDPSVARAIAASEARDRLAYRGLTGPQRVVAGRAAKLLFRARQFIIFAWQWTLRGSEQVLRTLLDWLLWLGDKLLFAPYRLALRGLIAIGRALTSGLKRLVGVALDGLNVAIGLLERLTVWFTRLLSERGTSSDLLRLLLSWQRRIQYLRRLLPVIKRIWQRAIERAWRHLSVLIKSGLAQAIHAVDWVSRNLIFRPLVWLFNPRRPGGGPLLGNETATRIAGFVLAMVALYIGVLLIAYVKAKALLLHGSINVQLWKAGAPVLVNLITIGAAHAAIAAGVLASKFVLLPVIAAARRGVKNNAATQAIAYRYVQRKKAAARLAARESKRRGTAGHVAQLGPLGFLDRLVEHIIAGTVPETYEVKLARQAEDDGSGSARLSAKPNTA